MTSERKLVECHSHDVNRIIFFSGGVLRTGYLTSAIQIQIRLCECVNALLHEHIIFGGEWSDGKFSKKKEKETDTHSPFGRHFI